MKEIIKMYSFEKKKTGFAAATSSFHAAVPSWGPLLSWKAEASADWCCGDWVEG